MTFWADGFTYEDVTSQLEKAEAKKLAAKQAPRRTGVHGLGASDDGSDDGDEAAEEEIPELKPYASNARFVAELESGLSPQELRSVDDRGRPRPVHIMVQAVAKVVTATACAMM